MFSGPIPLTFANLTSIREFVFFDNTLTGTLPHDCLGLVNLQYLDIGSNLLIGTLPASFQALMRMEYLYANDNYLTSSIPTEIGNMTQMVEFFVYDNFLTGTAPKSIAGLRKLSSINLGNNFLSGTLAGVFNASYQLPLNSVALNNNHRVGAGRSVPPAQLARARVGCELPGRWTHRYHVREPATVYVVFGRTQHGTCVPKTHPSRPVSYIRNQGRS